MPRPDGRRTTPPATRQLVVIEQVDLSKFMCHVRDKQGASHAAVFRNSNPLQEIPQVGQLWVAERMNSREWHLKERRENPTEAADRLALAPGQNIIRTGTDLLKVAGSGEVRFEVNSIKAKAYGTSGVTALSMGAMYWEQMVTGGGGATGWDLTYTPVSMKTVQLFNNGTLIDPTGLTLTGNHLDFGGTIASGHTVVVYYQTLPS